MTKPLVFNYKDHEELRAAYKELLADNQQLIADNRKLRQEVTELKQLNDGYVKIIAKNQETNNKLMASVQKQKEPHTQLLTLDDAVIVATRLFDIKGDDVEWVRCEFEQKTYLSNEQYCIGYEAAKREIIGYINGADMRGE